MSIAQHAYNGFEATRKSRQFIFMPLIGVALMALGGEHYFGVDDPLVLTTTEQAVTYAGVFYAGVTLAQLLFLITSAATGGGGIKIREVGNLIWPYAKHYKSVLY